VDHEFIAGIETWGSGGYMLDLVTLKDGKVLLITEHAVVLYESRSAFDSGIGGTTLESRSETLRLKPVRCS
jgi:hypothetical protein